MFKIPLTKLILVSEQMLSMVLCTKKKFKQIIA
jgi:hypothetical protein